MRLNAGYLVLYTFLISCGFPDRPSNTAGSKINATDSAQYPPVPAASPDGEGRISVINTGSVTPAELIPFAVSLTGIPYKYGSTDPKEGFDCSGFITYVFNHFGITVPRTSVDFTNVQREINLKDAKAGDLILFTGTDSTVRVVGHMGIIMPDKGQGLTFIHSTSGKNAGVTETPLNSYYIGRYVKTIRIFPTNNKAN